MELKQLTRLHLGNQCAEHFTFYEGVAPVLNSCGRTLKTLVLEQFTEMDPAFIGKSCPGLTHLDATAGSSRVLDLMLTSALDKVKT